MATAVAVHLAAWLALGPSAKLDTDVRGGAADAAVPAMAVELLQSPDRIGPAAARPLDRAAPRPRSTFEAAGALTTLPVAERPDGPPSLNTPPDDDPLFRVPFRDAVAQANAELRGGLGCAHVDLPELPRALLELCAAASRLGGDSQVVWARPSGPVRGDEGPRPSETDASAPVFAR